MLLRGRGRRRRRLEGRGARGCRRGGGGRRAGRCGAGGDDRLRRRVGLDRRNVVATALREEGYRAIDRDPDASLLRIVRIEDGIGILAETFLLELAELEQVRVVAPEALALLLLVAEDVVVAPEGVHRRDDRDERADADSQDEPIFWFFFLVGHSYAFSNWRARSRRGSRIGTSGDSAKRFSIIAITTPMTKNQQPRSARGVNWK